MQTINQFDLSELVHEFEDDVNWLDDINEAEQQLITSQYAYIKFGLVLQKVRNQCMWKRCAQKFLDFRSFCQSKVNLNIWQVSNAIKSAQVAVRLTFLGFTDLPRNASQALKMGDLSIERLGEVWGNVIKSCQGHKITALAIEQAVNPDKQPTTDTLKIPTLLGDKIRREAIERGISVTEYLEGLITGQYQHAECQSDNEHNFSEDEAKVIDDLDRQFKSIDRATPPKKVLENTLDRFDDFMHDLIGQFIPPVRRIANE
jgi:hypothetical protein